MLAERIRVNHVDADALAASIELAFWCCQISGSRLTLVCGYSGCRGDGALFGLFCPFAPTPKLSSLPYDTLVMTKSLDQSHVGRKIIIWQFECHEMQDFGICVFPSDYIRSVHVLDATAAYVCA